MQYSEDNDITPESYRQRFRAVKKKNEESNREFVARMSDLAEKWLKSFTTREALLDQVILEHATRGYTDFRSGKESHI